MKRLKYLGVFLAGLKFKRKEDWTLVHRLTWEYTEFDSEVNP